ncbi:MAG: DEAD/DEAH box helicase [Gammaproteobacteria bacterium]|nr:DEAD/DEAH box helicase [Gammaproteobacteria bacterium]
MSYAIGSLIKTRGREWVILPGSEPDLLKVRPLGGTEDETTGLYLPLEGDNIEPARFDLPSPDDAGDYLSSRLLRDALRLGFRSNAGPFRSFGRIAAEPRPYQLTPLLMALKLDPIRILIADDVGIGKTIEALLIARELLDRGEIRRFAVLCPPHLAEQWQSELHDKFHIQAERVLASTAAKLERVCGGSESLFDHYPCLVVSTDFIKSDRRCDEFLRSAPELVIIDEAHTCAWGEQRSGRHQRYQLVKKLSEHPERHLLLVTATPHSGKEEAFRSLLGFLKTDFSQLPEDLSGAHNKKHRRHLAAHFIQRKRGDITAYLNTDTPFPEREERDATYTLSPEYKKLFEKVLRYARKSLCESSQTGHRQRVRWWSALALLRALASSPAAAARTLRNRAAVADTETVEEADEIGRRTVFDLADEDAAENMDITPGADSGEPGDKGAGERRRLSEMARMAEKLQGKNDNKLHTAADIIAELLRNGFHPIVFCRFIQTAEYLTTELRKLLPKRTGLKDLEITAVTGSLPPEEREQRVLALGEFFHRLLIATDCLSEGINLQAHFDAVIHYDLSWNPTRHEQRAGRADRYKQPSPKVRVLTYYGVDNQIDGIVLDVLFKKHKSIRGTLGISVPMPVNSNQVVEAIFEGLLLKEQGAGKAGQLGLFDNLDDLLPPETKTFISEWDKAADREKKSRALFAQHSIKVKEAARELEAMQAAIGSGAEAARFVRTALEAHGARIQECNTALNIDLSESPAGLCDALNNPKPFTARFELPVKDKEIYLNRTHPLVENLAAYVFDTALDPLLDSRAKRAGVIRTRSVQKPAVLFLLRCRYHLITQRGGQEWPLLAEDCLSAAFTGAPNNPQWLDDASVEALFQAKADANMDPAQTKHRLQRILENFAILSPHLETAAKQHGQSLLDAHRRVRAAAAVKGIRYRVESLLPVDVVGLFGFMPI